MSTMPSLALMSPSFDAVTSPLIDETTRPPLDRMKDDAPEKIVSFSSDGTISKKEMLRRIDIVQDGLQQTGLNGLIVYGNYENKKNITYFTGFCPLDGTIDDMVLLLETGKKPILFVEESYQAYKASVTAFQVCRLDQLEEHLRSYFKVQQSGKVGMVGMNRMPSTLQEKVKNGLNKTPIINFRTFMLMRLFVFWQLLLQDQDSTQEPHASYLAFSK